MRLAPSAVFAVSLRTLAGLEAECIKQGSIHTKDIVKNFTNDKQDQEIL
jgi:hypothetical protein